jgi:predicted DNA-binding transcriptional regulator AlpA
MVDRTQPAQIISLESVRSKERILRAESVRKRFDPPPSRSTLNRWAKQGIIPGAFDLGGRPAWLESTFEAFLASCKPRDNQSDPLAPDLS